MVKLRNKRKSATQQITEKIDNLCGEELFAEIPKLRERCQIVSRIGRQTRNSNMMFFAGYLETLIRDMIRYKKSFENENTRHRA